MIIYTILYILALLLLYLHCPYTTLFRSATTDNTVLQSADVIVICVPTPLGDAGRPDLHAVESATQAIAENLRETSLIDRKSTRLNYSHVAISYAVFCLKIITYIEYYN